MKPAPLSGLALDSWAKNFLLAQGVIVSLLAIALFLAPGLMSTLWPWKVTPTLAQMYAGPLLSYGVGSYIYSKQEQWLGVRSIVPGMFSFAIATVIVSFMHFSLFSLTEIADLLWFGWFIVSSALLGMMTLRSLKAA
jgi:hypothetical protein